MYFSATGMTLGRRAVMAVDVAADDDVTASAPRVVTEGRHGVGLAEATGYGQPGFDVTPDRQRFLLLVPADDPDVALGRLFMLVNWVQELQRRAGA